MPNYLTFMLIGLPEGIIMFALYLALSGRSFWDARIIPIGIIGSTLIYFIRTLPLFWGLHTLFLLIFGVVVSVLLFKIKPVIAIRSVLIAFSILTVSEMVSIELLFALTGKTFEEVTSRPYLWALFGLPYLAVMAGATLLVRSYTLKKSLQKQGWVIKR